MATKRGKRGKGGATKGQRSTAKAVRTTGPVKAARKTAPSAPTLAAPAKRAAKPAAAPTRERRPATVVRTVSPGPTLLEEAERLRDQIQQSKLSHPDPWTYTPKARAWGQRAQALVERIASGGDGRQALEGLRAEVEADRDFQEARRLL